MGEIIKVGMADVNICNSPDAVTTLGLGSCVGIAIRDPNKKVGGLVHIMLPDSTEIKNNSNTTKFADTGIKELIRLLEEAGGQRRNFVAKIAGGAQMFAFQATSPIIRIGERNIVASKKVLEELRIPLLAEDTGENYGRTVTFYPESGKFEIKIIGKDLKII